MAGNPNYKWMVLLLLILLLSSNKSTTPNQNNQQSNQSSQNNLFNPSVSFTGQNNYVLGTALSGETVRVIRFNGEKKDLGVFSLNSGSINTEPDIQYKFYFFMNSTGPSSNYYPDVREYMGPAKDSTDNIVGHGCAIDTSLTFGSYDEYGRLQTATSNAQSLSTSQEKDLLIKIRTHSNKCYGMPNSTGQNIVCFGYTAVAITTVRADGGFDYTAAPSSISSHSSMTGKAVSCYKFDTIANSEYVDIPVHLIASASTEPTSAHNITVMSDDISVDLNQNNLDEIIGYVDEAGNELSAPAISLGTIYIT